MKKEKTNIFDRALASNYDQKIKRLSPIKDALHLCVRMVFSKLPADTKALIVGAGTGAELIYLAKVFPQWSFTVVEPAAAMLKICRQEAEIHNITERCTFHEGYLEALPNLDLFGVATSILVSHFFVNSGERCKYFSQIASRLQTGAYLIEVGLASDTTKFEFKALVEIWTSMHEYAGMPVNIESFGDKVAVLPAEEVKAIIESGGFVAPILFYQALLIHAWFAKVGSAEKIEFKPVSSS